MPETCGACLSLDSKGKSVVMSALSLCQDAITLYKLVLPNHKSLDDERNAENPGRQEEVLAIISLLRILRFYLSASSYLNEDFIAATPP